MYHHIAPAAPDDEFEARLTVLTSDFEEQLAYLKCAGYTGITVGQLIDAMDGRGALPSRPIVLTFDDGYSDAYTQAFPLLRQYGFPGSFAIVTGFVGGGDGAYVTWDQVREMASAGMEMLSHTVSHIDLGTSDDASVREELLQSKAALEEHTGQPVRSLVYPSGEPFRSGTPERQTEVVSMLREAGYEAALLAGPNSITQDPGARFELNRVRVSGGEDVATFAASIGGPACP
jgi:peptidoglycan/xylan/chitin deacetylase (PgdA/CDA1 family)